MSIKRALGRRFWKHDKWMRHYELLVFQVFYENLEPPYKEHFVRQLWFRDIFDRSPKGKIIMIGDAAQNNFECYDITSRLPQVSKKSVYLSDGITKETQTDSYKFTIKCENKVMVKVVVTTIMGILRELQFTKIPAKFEAKILKYRNIPKYFLHDYSGLPEGISYSFDGFTNENENEHLESESFNYGEV